jgi:hypothetical protein
MTLQGCMHLGTQLALGLSLQLRRVAIVTPDRRSCFQTAEPATAEASSEPTTETGSRRCETKPRCQRMFLCIHTYYADIYAQRLHSSRLQLTFDASVRLEVHI